MSEPLPFVAFAAPDGSAWGLALGSARALEPGIGPEAAGELERLLGSAEGLITAAVDALPALSGRLPELPSGSSVRLAVAVFASGRVFGLSAVRPRRARGHDRDAIEALVQEDGVDRPVDDPRLSVTLDSAGRPLRLGLELWLAQDDEGAYDVPRRAAGEVQAPFLELELGALTADAHRVRWRSRGEDGSGWFVLVHAR